MKLIAPHFESYSGQKEEQALLKDALAREGIMYSPWDATEGEIPEGDAIFWQGSSSYYQRMDRYESLLREVENKRLPSLNSVFLTQWNLRKNYLQELAEAGVAMLPTFWPGSFDATKIKQWMHTGGYEEIVVKPVVSAGAYLTFRLALEDNRSWEQAEESYRKAGMPLVMVQPFAPEILEQGELSFLFFGGAFSHMVRKLPKGGDYRIQHVHGGSYQRENPEVLWLQQAQEILEKLPETPVYGRVDGIMREGRLLLMEVELIEPYFYFDAAAENVPMFARAVKNAIELPTEITDVA